LSYSTSPHPDFSPLGQSYMVTTLFCVHFNRNIFLLSPGAVGLCLWGISASDGSTVHLPDDTNEYETLMG